MFKTCLRLNNADKIFNIGQVEWSICIKLSYGIFYDDKIRMFLRVRVCVCLFAGLLLLQIWENITILAQLEAGIQGGCYKLWINMSA